MANHHSLENQNIPDELDAKKSFQSWSQNQDKATEELVSWLMSKTEQVKSDLSLRADFGDLMKNDTFSKAYGQLQLAQDLLVQEMSNPNRKNQSTGSMDQTAMQRVEKLYDDLLRTLHGVMNAPGASTVSQQQDQDARTKEQKKEETESFFTSLQRTMQGNELQRVASNESAAKKIALAGDIEQKNSQKKAESSLDAVYTLA